MIIVESFSKSDVGCFFVKAGGGWGETIISHAHHPSLIWSLEKSRSEGRLVCDLQKDLWYVLALYSPSMTRKWLYKLQEAFFGRKSLTLALVQSPPPIRKKSEKGHLWFTVAKRVRSPRDFSRNVWQMIWLAVTRRSRRKLHACKHASLSSPSDPGTSEKTKETKIFKQSFLAII